jgi:protein SCO1/2/putative membrane protein
VTCTAWNLESFAEDCSWVGPPFRWNEGHRFLLRMGLTIGASTPFLMSCLAYHYQVGSIPFTGHGGIRAVYFTILISHTVLAAAIPPLAIITVSRALRERFDRHVRIARWTLPLWLYVSVTGVIIYFMLYHLYPPA